jgi:hypothetical protein
MNVRYRVELSQTERAELTALLSAGKHASWLNMVEIEIGVLRGQCLDRRIATQEQLVSEVAAWERQRNASRARIKWMFTTDKARAKMGRAYPDPAAVRQPQTKES